MALISCSECKKEISDKAVSCPHCGNPLIISRITNTSSLLNDNESFVCPKCNSTQLTSNKKGYSVGKAAAGVVLTGGIGLVAGAIGSNKVIVSCLKCGHKFKAGDYLQEKNKFDKKRREQIEANQERGADDQSNGCLIIIFLSLSVFGFIISYKLFSNDWPLLGIIFSLATLICISMTFYCIYDEMKKTSK